MSKKHFKHYPVTIGTVTIGIAILLIWAGYALGSRITEVEKLWSDYNQRATAASHALNRINTSLGYGGFIHNFKNYILRQEPKLIPTIHRNLQNAREALASYRTLEISNDEKQGLQLVSDTIGNYDGKFRLATKLVEQGATPTEIDRQVRIDDMPALESILFLAGQALERANQKERETNQALISAMRLLKSAGLLIPFVLLAGITLILFFKRVVEANELLAAEQNHLDNLLDVSPEPMLTTNKRGQIIRANTEAVRLFGYTQEKLKQMTIEDLMPERFRAHHKTFTESYFSNPQPKHSQTRGQLTALCQDGREIPVDISLSFLKRRGETQAIASLRDTSHWLKAEEALRMARDELEKSVLERTADLAEAQRIGHIGNWRWNQATGEMHCSTEAQSILGQPTAGTKAPIHTCFGIIHADDKASFQDSLAQTLNRPQTSCDIEFRIHHPDGHLRYLHLRGESSSGENGTVEYVIGTLQEITERKKAEQELKLAESVFSGTNEGIIITDKHGTILRVNEAFTTITGYSEADAIGKTPSILQSHRHDANFYQAMKNQLLRTHQWEGEIWNRRKSGSLIPVRQSITAVTDEQGRISQYIGIFSDITERKLSEERIRHLAHYDALTDLPNRLLFNDRCEHALVKARREGHKVAILFMDLDRFKHINDSLGHPVGDSLLKAVAERLTSALREQDTVGRLGGDEFAVVVDEIGQPEDASMIADKLISVLNEPIFIENYELHISTSIGISLFPDDADDVPGLLKNADAAMYRAKDLGRSTYQHYTSELTQTAFDRIQLEGQLKFALEREQFSIHYQPQYSLESGKMTGCEALMRWQHPELGNIPPDKFIPLAEETGVIQSIGKWILTAACTQMKTWQDTGLDAGKMAVNLSGAQVQRQGIVETVTTALSESGLDPEYLELEITESFVMGYAEQAASVLESLEKLGVTLAIDDFGTGYSSLNYLKRLPFHKLKIDQSFVRDMSDDTHDEAIVRAVIALGNSMQLKVIAEGAETEGQVSFLKNEGCHEVQGYFYNPPLPANDIEDVIRAHKVC